MDLRVDSAGQVEVKVLNVTGQLVAVILSRTESAGNYRISWDGRNRNGAVVGNGVYFIVVQQPSGTVIRKVIVLK